MTIRESLYKKLDKLYEYINQMKKQQAFFEKIVSRIEKDINKAEEEIANINIELDSVEESLFNK